VIGTKLDDVVLVDIWEDRDDPVVGKEVLEVLLDEGVVVPQLPCKNTRKHVSFTTALLLLY
jgi:hypothetical protein